MRRCCTAASQFRNARAPLRAYDRSMPIPSAVDQAFFLLETPERPMNVGVLIVLAPPAKSRARFADQLVARMLECPVGPPFSYRVKPGPIRPLLALEQDDSIDARRQVHRHSLGRKPSLEKLFARVCAIHIEAAAPRSAALGDARVHGPAGRTGGALLQDPPRADRRHRLPAHRDRHRGRVGGGPAAARILGGHVGGARSGARSPASGVDRRRTAAGRRRRAPHGQRPRTPRVAPGPARARSRARARTRVHDDARRTEDRSPAATGCSPTARCRCAR